MMTDDEKAALVEELAEAFAKEQQAARHMVLGETGSERILAYACLPIIDALLAAHDLDGMLASVHSDAKLGCLLWVKSESHYEAEVIWPYHPGWDGNPPYMRAIANHADPMAAIKAAVAQAHGRGEVEA